MQKLESIDYCLGGPIFWFCQSIVPLLLDPLQVQDLPWLFHLWSCHHLRSLGVWVFFFFFFFFKTSFIITCNIGCWCLNRYFFVLWDIACEPFVTKEEELVLKGNILSLFLKCRLLEDWQIWILSMKQLRIFGNRSICCCDDKTFQ